LANRIGVSTILRLGLTLLAAGCGGGRDEARERASYQAVRSLPYLASLPAAPARARKRGVVRHLGAAVDPGLNLYTSKRWTEARLVDLQGRLVHRWQRPPEPPVHPTLARRAQEYLEGWMHVELAAGGDLFVIQEMHSLARLDRSSRLLWRAPLPAHHDLAQAADGRVWVLSAAPRRERVAGGSELFLDNLVVTLGADGRPLARRSVMDALRTSPVTAEILRQALERRAGWSQPLSPAAVSLPSEPEREATLPVLRDYLAGVPLPERLACSLLYLSPADVLHTNSIEILERDVPGLGQRGDYLLAVRNLDLLVVVSASSGRVLWHWGPGVLDQMHQPTVLPSGHLLVLDNGAGSGRSRLLEIDPVRREVVWSWQADPPASFFTAYMGGAEALGNGNLLVTDSLASRAFELSRDGALVWEYYEPALIDAAQADRAEAAVRAPAIGTLPPRVETVTIYRMARVPPAALGWLPATAR
jgi:hypothetical protein